MSEELGNKEAEKPLASPDDKSISAGHHLTVVIRDDSPMIFCGDGPAYRRVTVTLTDEQVARLRLRYLGQSGEHVYHESVSVCFLE